MSMSLTDMVKELYVDEGRAALTSIADSLRRIADALEKPEITGQPWPDAPFPQGLGEHLRARCDQAEQLQAELDARFEPDPAIDPNSDQMRGIEMARALEMMHRSGRYGDILERRREVETEEFGLIASLPFLFTVFSGRTEAEVERRLLAVPGARIIPVPNSSLKRLFVPTDNVGA